MAQEKGVVLLAYCNSPSAGYLENLSDEVLKVKDCLKASEIGHTFDIEVEPIDTPEVFAARIGKYKNRLVSFSYSGHAGEEEIVLSDGSAHGVHLLTLLSQCPHLKMVLLNGCATGALAQKGKDLGIPLLIGTNRSVPDRNAARFAVHFFMQLSQQETIGAAFRFANSASAIRLDNEPDRMAGRRNNPSIGEPYWNHFGEASLFEKNFLQLCKLPEGQMKGEPIRIYLSYSKKDARWKDELLSQMTPLIKAQKIAVWDESQILPGARWEKEIEINLQRSDVFLFLISADSLSSSDVMDRELPAALAKEKDGRAVVIPVIVRPCLWQMTDFGALAKDGKPISLHENKDQALMEVVMRLDDLLS